MFAGVCRVPENAVRELRPVRTAVTDERFAHIRNNAVRKLDAVPERAPNETRRIGKRAVNDVGDHRARVQVQQRRLTFAENRVRRAQAPGVQADSIITRKLENAVVETYRTGAVAAVNRALRTTYGARVTHDYVVEIQRAAVRSNLFPVARLRFVAPVIRVRVAADRVVFDRREDDRRRGSPFGD